MTFGAGPRQCLNELIIIIYLFKIALKFQRYIPLSSLTISIQHILRAKFPLEFHIYASNNRRSQLWFSLKLSLVYSEVLVIEECRVD
jgi:hypothetical protein